MLTTAIVAAVWVLLFYFLIPSLGSSKKSQKPKDEFNYDYKMWEYNFNIARGVSKKKRDIEFIESNIPFLKGRIATNDNYIKMLKERYPDGLHGFLTLTLRPEHYDLIELCGDEEVDNQYKKVLHEQHELEDRIYAQDHLVKMYDKYCVQKDWNKNA